MCKCVRACVIVCMCECPQDARVHLPERVRRMRIALALSSGGGIAGNEYRFSATAAVKPPAIIACVRLLRAGGKDPSISITVLLCEPEEDAHGPHHWLVEFRGEATCLRALPCRLACSARPEGGEQPNWSHRQARHKDLPLRWRETSWRKSATKLPPELQHDKRGGAKNEANEVNLARKTSWSTPEAIGSANQALTRRRAPIS